MSWCVDLSFGKFLVPTKRLHDVLDNSADNWSYLSVKSKCKILFAPMEGSSILVDVPNEWKKKPIQIYHLFSFVRNYYFFLFPLYSVVGLTVVVILSFLAFSRYRSPGGRFINRKLKFKTPRMKTFNSWQSCFVSVCCFVIQAPAGKWPCNH